MTGFYGTYHYTSPEMKKRYQLQERAFVDLYYNDLHCLQQTLKQLAIKWPKTQLFDYLTKNNRKTQIKCSQIQNQAIVNYFRLKLTIFQQNYKELLFKVQKETILLRTVRKLLQKVQSKIDMENIDNISISVRSHKVDSEEFYQIDNMLYEYQIKTQTNPLLVNFLQIIQQVCESDTLFQQAWQQQQYKQNIFFFIDVYSRPDPLIQKQKQSLTKKLINKIYHHIGYSEEASDTMKFRAILIYYAGYFQRKENVEILEKIMIYFLLMHDDRQRGVVEDKILSIFEKKQNWSEYNQRNFKYFIGHLATLDYRTSQDYAKYSQNAEKGALKSEMHEQQARLIKFIIDLKIKRISQATIQKYLLTLSSQKNQLSQQINYFVKVLLEDKLTNLRQVHACQLFNYKYKDHYLEKCQFMMNMIKSSESQQVLSITKLFEEESFLSRYPTLIHLNSLNLSNLEDLNKKIMISKDYLQMIGNPDSTFNLIYLQALLSVSSIEFFENYVLNYFRNLQLSKINNFEKLENFHTKVFTILYILINIQNSGVTRVGSNYLDTLTKILLSFVEFSFEIKPIYQTSIQSQTEASLEKATHKYKTRLNFIRFLILMLAKKEQQAIDVMLVVFDQFQEQQSDLATYTCLCYIAENFTEKQRMRIRETIIKMVPNLVTGSRFETFIVVPRFLSVLLKTYQEMGLMQETFTYISQLCAFIQTKRISFYLQIFLKRVEDFIRTFTRSQLQYFVKYHIKLELVWFSGCFALTKFLYLAGKLLEAQGNQLETSNKMRLNIICVYFVREMPEGCYTSRFEYNHENLHASIVFPQSKKQSPGPDPTRKGKRQVQMLLPVCDKIQKFRFPMNANREIFNQKNQDARM